MSKDDEMTEKVMMRLDLGTLRAMERACAAEHRDKSNLARHAMLEWLTAHGYLPTVDKPRGR